MKPANEHCVRNPGRPECWRAGEVGAALDLRQPRDDGGMCDVCTRQGTIRVAV